MTDSDAGGAPAGSGLPRGPRLGVDVGLARVGLAASDPDGLIATPVETLARDLGRRPRMSPKLQNQPDTPNLAEGEILSDAPADIRRIAAEVRERGAKVVYIGLPRHLSGAEGSAARDARAYAGTVARVIAPVDVRLVDERMTSVAAHRALRDAGRAGRKHRPVVDQVAAVIVLQGALDAERAADARVGAPVAVPRYRPKERLGADPEHDRLDHPGVS